MKKRKFLLSIIAATALITLASCGGSDDKTTNSGSDTSQVVPGSQDTPSTPGSQDIPSTPGSQDTTAPTEDNPVTEAPVVSFYTSADAEPVKFITVNEKGQFVLPADATLPEEETEYKKFVGWFTEAEGGVEVSPIDEIYTQDVSFYAHYEVATEEVTFTLDTSKLAAQSVTDKLTQNKYTFTAGAIVRSENKTYTSGSSSTTYPQGVKLEGTSTMEVKVEGPGTLTIYFAFRGSTNAWVADASGAYKFPFSIKEPGKEATTVDVNFDCTAGKTAKYTMNVDKGTYVFANAGSTLDVLGADLVETIEKSKPSAITVEAKNVDFIVGQDFSKADLVVSQVYENGTTSEIEEDKYSVDASNYNANASGVYTITVTANGFSTTYQVNVYKVDSIKLYDHVQDSGKTMNLQKVFLQNGTFNNKNLAIHAECSLEGSDKTKSFVINASDCTISGGATSAVGKQTVTVTYKEKSASYDVYVVENVLADATAPVVNVDAEKEVSVTTTSVTFKTINDAIQYLRLCELDSDTTKTINVAAGTYTEKVEVDVPNLAIVGAGQANTTVVFDCIAGKLDPSEKNTYSTNGSATMSVRTSAYGFTLKNIKVMNYYNTNALYEESKMISDNTQAVALYCDADMSVFENVTLSSYHDTLYANKGRQYYLNCRIEGRTDYIFGDTATAYFKGCQIFSIGAGVTEGNGGYVVATKGSGVEYGYVFDTCSFDGDENVQDGSVSLGRTWASGMKIAVINCTLSKKFSKTAYGDKTTSLNNRYTQMKDAAGYEIIPGNFVEYNNTGDGAITASLAGTCTVLTAEQAENYTNLNKVFAKTNGSVTYTQEWNPVATKDATVVFKDTSGNVLGTAASAGYSGKTLTLSQYKNLFNDNATLPDGKALDSFYTDATLATPVTDATVLVSGENVIYVKLIDASSVVKTFSMQSSLTDALCNGTKVTGDVAIDSVFFMTNGDKGAANTGADKDTYPYYIQTGGSAQVSSDAGKNLVGIKVTGACTITIYYSSASSDGTSRELSIYKSLDDVKNKTNATLIGSSSDYTVVSGTYTYTGTEETTLYIGTSNGMRIYNVVVQYN